MFAFYSEGDGEPVKTFEQRHEVIYLDFQENDSNCSVREPCGLRGVLDVNEKIRVDFCYSQVAL